MYLPEGRFVIEQAPAWGEGSRRGAVAEGAVGARALGRFRLFRYEIRSWREGIIPDIAEAVESPLRLSDEPEHAQRLLELAPQVPTARLGARRAGHRRDVELELDRLMAPRQQRAQCRLDLTSPRRESSRLESRNRDRASLAGNRQSGPHARVEASLLR